MPSRYTARSGYGYIAREASNAMMKEAFNYAAKQARAYFTKKKSAPKRKVTRKRTRAGVKKYAPSSAAERKRGSKLAVGNMRLMMQKKGVKKRPPAKASLYGSIQKRDRGGQFFDKNTVYVGHSTYVPADMLESLARAMTRKLFRKAGLDPKAWTDLLPLLPTGQRWGIRIERFFKGNTTQASAVDVLASDAFVGDTYNQYALLVGGLLRGQLPEADHEMLRVFLVKADGTGAVLDRPSNIDPGRMMINFQCTSELKIQNITKPQGNITGTDIQDIGNNPLHGYYICGTGNGFLDKGQERAVGLTNEPTEIRKAGFLASATEQGLIGRRALSTNYAQMPMDANDFTNAKMQNKTYVKPGDIKMSRLYSSFKMTILGFLNTFRKDIGLSPQDPSGDVPNFLYYKQGKCAMWGLRRVLDMGTVEDNVSAGVGFELNYKVGSYLTEAGASVCPDLVITTETPAPP
jgi:hypothetical protein